MRTWPIESALQLLNIELAYRQPTYLKNDRSSLIDWFISSTNLTSPSMQVRHDLSLDSDRKLVRLTFTPDSGLPQHDITSPRRLWRLSRLQNSKIQDIYVQHFTNNTQLLAEKLIGLNPSEDTQPPQFDSLADEFYQAIYDALDDSVGPPSIPSRTAKWFWTPASRQLWNAGNIAIGNGDDP